MNWKIGVAALGAAALIAGAASAEVIVNSDGAGFVGKGDVQLALGLNNAGVQALGNPVFTYESVTETTWECYRAANDKTQERSRTTTVAGVLSSVARVKNQITGYNLLGWTTSTSTTDGPAVGSCPANPSGFVFVEGSVQTEAVPGGGLSVNGVPLQ